MLNRVFKTKRFAVMAKKALIPDVELCAAMRDVMHGLADNLGGGVWKKRLNENRHRSIIVTRGRSFWVYQFLFAKQDQSNISRNELIALKQLARAYEGLGIEEFQLLLDRNEIVEICHDKKI